MRQGEKIGNVEIITGTEGGWGLGGGGVIWLSVRALLAYLLN